MLGILYLILCYLLGYNIILAFFPGLFGNIERKTLSKRLVQIPEWLNIVPASFLFGILFMSWLTYYSSLAGEEALKLFNIKHNYPLLLGNTISFWIAAIFIFVNYFLFYKRYPGIFKLNIKKLKNAKKFAKENMPELIAIFVIMIIYTAVSFYSFRISGDKLFIGSGVCDESSLGVSTLRSFSYGQNIPADSPMLAGAKIRYNFMFYFLAGNLEYLGMPIDFALNIPTILTIIAFFIVVYNIVYSLTGKKEIGLIALLLCIFKSSLLFYFVQKDLTFDEQQADISNSIDNGGVLGSFTNMDFANFSTTPHFLIEQRGLVFSLAVFMVLLKIFIQLYLKMNDYLYNDMKIVEKMIYSNDNNNEEKNNDSGKFGKLKTYLKYYLWELLFTKKAWIIENKRRTLVGGLILGLLFYFDARIYMAALLMFIVLMIFSCHKLEFILSLIIGVLSGAVNIKIISGDYGIIENLRLQLAIKSTPTDMTFIEIFAKYAVFLGVIPLFLLIFYFINAGCRRLILVGFLPLLSVFLSKVMFNLDENPAVVVSSVVFLNVFFANILYLLVYNNKKKIVSASIVVIILATCVSGINDFISYFSANSPDVQFHEEIKLNDTLTKWFIDNTLPNETVLYDAEYRLNPVSVSGRKLFLAKPLYRLEQMGYNTDERLDILARIFSSKDAGEIVRYANNYNIKYLVIDEGIVNVEAEEFNFQILDKNFEKVFEYDDEGRIFKIYKLI